MRRLSSPSVLAALGIVLLALVAGVLLVAPSDDYLLLPNEAHPVAPLVDVEGGKEPTGSGAILFVDIVVRRATLLEKLLPPLRGDGASLTPAHAVNPAGLPEEARRRTSRREMTRSQAVAAAVALRELGYDVEADPAGALVAAVLPDAPADGKLEPTDVVVSVGGTRVRTPGDLRQALGAVDPGAEVELGVNRDGVVRSVAIETAESPREPGRAAIGVLVEQAADIELPIDVEIDSGDVGGPSAGLAFALEVLEELGRDVDGGMRVAVTGELELDGDVEPVGGLKQKTIGARRTGVDVFVVPAGENAEEARRYAGGLRIVAVRNFQQALRALATLP
jgi:PDZ domain-containing protein